MPENLNCSGKSDEEIVNLSLNDQDWFSCLIERYHEKLLRYIKRISNVSHQEAEDILQDVFLKVYENLNGFDTDLKFSSWIYRITHNQTISNFRKNKSRPQQLFLDDDGAFLNNIASDLNLEKEIEKQDVKTAIGRALLKLENKYSEILILKFFEDKDYREISDILKKPIGTVASLINRGKEKLKKELLKQNLI